jgi:hypothetical protein
MNWDTLRISAESMELPPEKEKVKRVKKGREVVDDSSADIPWTV